MGAYQSTPDAKPPALCSLQTKNGEFVLVPLIEKYFPDVDFPAFRALYRAREDGKTRFFYSRPEDDDCSTPGDHVTAEMLYKIFVTHQTTQLRSLPVSTSCPIGCAVGMVVTDNGPYDAVYAGRRVRICGRIACRNAGGETLPWSAGIYLSHQFTEGLFKYIAVIAAAMYVHQTGDGSIEHFRSIDFTTLQQNTAMLRAVFTLRELVNCESDRLSATSSFTSSPSAEDYAAGVVAPPPPQQDAPPPAHVGVTFEPQANRYRMCVLREHVYTIAQCLSALVSLKQGAPKDSNDWVTFELKHRLPVNEIVTMTAEATAMMTNLLSNVVITVLDVDASDEEDMKELRICRIYSPKPLTVDTLDEAVYLLSRLSRMCDEHLQKAQQLRGAEGDSQAMPNDSQLFVDGAENIDVKLFPFTMHLQRRIKKAAQPNQR